MPGLASLAAFVVDVANRIARHVSERLRFPFQVAGRQDAGLRIFAMARRAARPRPGTELSVTRMVKMPAEIGKRWSCMIVTSYPQDTSDKRPLSVGRDPPYIALLYQYFGRNSFFNPISYVRERVAICHVAVPHSRHEEDPGEISGLFDPAVARGHGVVVFLGILRRDDGVELALDNDQLMPELLEVFEVWQRVAIFCEQVFDLLEIPVESSRPGRYTRPPAPSGRSSRRCNPSAETFRCRRAPRWEQTRP